MKREYPFAIIEKLGKELAGEDINEKINVLDVNIDSCTAKEAMKETIAFLESEPVSVIDVVSVDGLMQMNDLSELKARMKAITRRTDNMRKQEKKDSVIEIGGLKMDTDAIRVFFNDREINLTVKEFDVLVLLITHPNKVYSRDKLLSLIWGDSYIGEARTVDVHVSRLRDKLSMVSGKKFIHTKWGVGYYFEA